MLEKGAKYAILSNILKENTKNIENAEDARQPEMHSKNLRDSILSMDYEELKRTLPEKYLNY